MVLYVLFIYITQNNSGIINYLILNEKRETQSCFNKNKIVLEQGIL